MIEKTFSTFLKALLAVALGLCICLPASAAGTGCKDCYAELSGVHHGAGGNDDVLRKKIEREITAIRFAGAAVHAQSRSRVTGLVQQMRRLPAQSVVKISVGADAALSGEAASTQAMMRMDSLRQALLKAGAPQDRFELSVR